MWEVNIIIMVPNQREKTCAEVHTDNCFYMNQGKGRRFETG